MRVIHTVVKMFALTKTKELKATSLVRENTGAAARVRAFFPLRPEGLFSLPRLRRIS